MCFLCPVLAAQSTSAGKLGAKRQEEQLLRRDTLQRDTVWQAAAPRYVAPLGDFRLRRFRRSVFRFDSVPAGDTLSVELVSTAEPFKKVALYPIDTQKNVPVFKHQSQAEKTRKPILTIKNKWSLKRGLAHLEALSTPPARAAMRYMVREVLIQPNGTPKPDTLQRDWAIGEQGQKTLLDEQGVQRDSTGRISRKKKTITIVKHPAKPIALSPSGVQVLPRKGERVFRYSDFKPGDTLLFTVATVGKKPLKSVSLSDAQKRYHRKTLETALFSDKVTADKEAYWMLRVAGHFGLQKQQANITVLRIPPARIDSIVQRSDTVWKVETKPLYDTLALTIKDDSLLLPPVLNLAQKNVASVEIAIPDTLPKGFSLMFAAYWVGINRPCLDTYQALENAVPPNWIKPGVPPALCAYALGYPLQLPPITLSDVALAFNRGGAYPNNKNDATPLWGVSLKQSMGVISADALRKARTQKGTHYFYVYFKNNNNVNTYPAQVKIIAFYRKKKGEETKTTVLSIDNR